MTVRTQPQPRSQLRATFAVVSDEGQWHLAGIHMSFIAGTPGAPPVPGHAPIAARSGAVAAEE
jgi:hypothetical protein